jgi:hypothetical protein
VYLPARSTSDKVEFIGMSSSVVLRVVASHDTGDSLPFAHGPAESASVVAAKALTLWGLRHFEMNRVSDPGSSRAWRYSSTSQRMGGSFMCPERQVTVFFSQKLSMPRRFGATGLPCPE